MTNERTDVAPPLDGLRQLVEQLKQKERAKLDEACKPPGNRSAAHDSFAYLSALSDVEEGLAALLAGPSPTDSDEREARIRRMHEQVREAEDRIKRTEMGQSPRAVAGPSPVQRDEIVAGEVIALDGELRSVRVSVIDGEVCRDRRNRVAVRNVATNRLSYIPEWRLRKAKRSALLSGGSPQEDRE